jgi:SAM-dependent methyltransferase
MATFAERVTPASVREGFTAIAANNAALRVTQTLASERIWDWIHTVGLVWDEELANLLPPVPPVELRRITNSPDAAQFLWSGMLHAELIVERFERHRRTVGLASVLDFGCGCGRICRYLAMRPDYWTVHACEVNPAHVSWLNAHLPTVQTACSPLDPPLDYDAAQFDLVYALSVFSHLPEQRALPWLTELHRILKPGGLLIITTPGTVALNKAAVSNDHLHLLGLEQGTIEAAREKLQSDGIVYTEYSAQNAAVAGAGPSYGVSIVSLDKLGQWAGDCLEIVEHDEGGLSMWQDITVMRAL